MKIEPSEYQIICDDGDQFFIVRTQQPDRSFLWKINGDTSNYCLNKNLDWVYEAFLSSRSDEFLKSTRFKYDEAIETIINFKNREKNV